VAGDRLTVGLLFLMPILLIGGDVLILAADPRRGSFSAYHSVRDVFVGILCVVGIFLVTYKISGRDWDNGLTLIAGAGRRASRSSPPGETAPASR
jgi:hypothetical protein